MRKTAKPTGGSRKRSPAPRRRRTGVAAALAAFVEVVRRRRLRWYLFGALAVALYGVARTSADADVTVALPPGGLEPFVRDMEHAGFTVREVADPAELERFVAATRVVPFVHDASGFPLDVVLAGPGLEELFFAAVRTRRFEGVTVSVLAPEDLIVTTILAARAKDLEDVRGILRRRDVELDLRRIRSLVTALEESLGGSDLAPRLDQLLRETSRRR